MQYSSPRNEAAEGLTGAGHREEAMSTSIWNRAAIGDPHPQPADQAGATAAWGTRLVFACISLAAFALYWYSSFLLEEREGTTHFAADTWFYTELAKGDIFGRMVDESDLSRIFRFHATTVFMAAAWMKVFGSLAPWIDPVYILKGMFAAVGAAGVWAAMSALARVVPRWQAAMWGLIYAVSLGVWYFASLEESKIVSAALAGVYIALYLNLRQRWTLHGAALLTAVLFFACLNEVVAGFLVIIPVVDTLVQHGWNVSKGKWIAWHALIGPVALAFLEGIRRFWPGAAGFHPEGASHFTMLFYNLAQNDYDVESLYAFLVRWFFFNFAAPEANGAHWADPSINYGGDFRPVLSTYFSSPVTIALVVLAAVMLVACLLPRRHSARVDASSALLLALVAYALLRAAFFFVFVPKECFLFANSATLAHVLIVAIAFAASSLPAKPVLLLALAALLFIANGVFIAGYGVELPN
jgi:hypothetical protein